MDNNCIFCNESIYQYASFFQQFQPPTLLCRHCCKKLKKINKWIKIGQYNVFVFFEYNDFFEQIITQYKDSGDSILKHIFIPQLKWIKQHYPLTDIIIPPTHPNKLKTRFYHPLQYLLQDFNCVDCFIKTKNYKQSLQNRSNRINIKKYIQLKTLNKLFSLMMLLHQDQH